MHPERFSLRGDVCLRLLNPDGSVADERQFRNLRLTGGWRKVLDASSPKTLKDYAQICIGTGSTAANIADTALQTETARAAGAVTNPTPDQLQISVTIAAGVGTGTITESCLDYDSSPTGAPLCRQIFTGLAKTADKALQCVWTLS